MENKKDIVEIDLQEIECLKCEANGIQCEHQKKNLQQGNLCCAVKFN